MMATATRGYTTRRDRVACARKLSIRAWGGGVEERSPGAITHKCPTDVQIMPTSRSLELSLVHMETPERTRSRVYNNNS